MIWEPGLPYVAAALGGLALSALAVWNRWYLSCLLVLGGATAVLTALVVVATSTWFPANPQFPEPALPQVVLAACGAVAIVAGVRIGWVAAGKLPDPEHLPRPEPAANRV